MYTDETFYVTHSFYVTHTLSSILHGRLRYTKYIFYTCIQGNNIKKLSKFTKQSVENPPSLLFLTVMSWKPFSKSLNW